MKKPNNYTRGLLAESLAAFYFSLLGYKILAKRYKTPQGEIDLVAKRGKTLVFIEVKWHLTAADSAYAISQTSLKRITRAAESYLKRHADIPYETIRFDALLFSAYPVSQWIVHLKNVSML